VAEPGVRVVLGDWATMRAQAASIRHTVFVEEQKVPVDIELDEFDAVSLHALAFDAAGTAVGTGRLLPDGHIGRMAVLASARGMGVGGALLQALLAAASERGMREVQLNAQTHALPFYARFGFSPEGDTFDDAGIAHRTMRRSL
jgi:predicted GNAT family N-acyltransferase